MAMDVYDQLASAVQAVMAEKEASEEGRIAKVRAAFERSGHLPDLALLMSALDKPAPRATAKK